MRTCRLYSRKEEPRTYVPGLVIGSEWFTGFDAPPHQTRASLAAPILLGFPLHRWRIRILALKPIRRHTGVMEDIRAIGKLTHLAA